MKYKKGQKLYKKNNKTNEIEELYIEDTLYKLSRPIKGKYNYNDEELEYLIAEGIVSDNIEIVKENAIKDLEERFNIKLKEI